MNVGEKDDKEQRSRCEGGRGGLPEHLQGRVGCREVPRPGPRGAAVSAIRWSREEWFHHEPQGLWV